MVRQVKTEYNGPKQFRTWSEEKPLWWILWRTHAGGHWNDDDRREFLLMKAKYLIMFDHTQDARAREVAVHILDREPFFKGAKVSKFARDGEKTMVLLGRDASHRDAVAEFIKPLGMLLHSIKPAQYVSDAEKQANAKWGQYLHNLARAYGAKPN